MGTETTHLINEQQTACGAVAEPESIVSNSFGDLADRDDDASHKGDLLQINHKCTRVLSTRSTMVS